MNAATTLPLVIPLAAAAATLIASRSLMTKRVISITATTSADSAITNLLEA